MGRSWLSGPPQLKEKPSTRTVAGGGRRGREGEEEGREAVEEVTEGENEEEEEVEEEAACHQGWVGRSVELERDGESGGGRGGGREGRANAPLSDRQAAQACAGGARGVQGTPMPRPRSAWPSRRSLPHPTSSRKRERERGGGGREGGREEMC